MKRVLYALVVLTLSSIILGCSDGLYKQTAEWKRGVDSGIQGYEISEIGEKTKIKVTVVCSDFPARVEVVASGVELAAEKVTFNLDGKGMAMSHLNENTETGDKSFRHFLNALSEAKKIEIVANDKRYEIKVLQGGERLPKIDKFDKHGRGDGKCATKWHLSKIEEESRSKSRSKYVVDENSSKSDEGNKAEKNNVNASSSDRSQSDVDYGRELRERCNKYREVERECAVAGNIRQCIEIRYGMAPVLGQVACDMASRRGY